MVDSTEDNVEFFSPLSEFYKRVGLPQPPTRRLPGSKMPQPYRDLLVHDGDMTPRLEQFHGQRVSLCTLDSRVREQTLTREVILVAVRSGRAVEFGAAAIHLDPFPPSARRQIRGNHRPLGAILGDCDLGHFSRPVAYFQVRADALIGETLGLPGAPWVWGRSNRLYDRHQNVLAQVVEIVAPEADPTHASTGYGSLQSGAPGPGDQASGALDD